MTVVVKNIGDWFLFMCVSSIIVPIFFDWVIIVRLDKFICESTELTRSLAKRALHRGDVTCDGVVVKNSGFKVLPQMAVHLDGTLISIIGERYIMLNKPVDTICSTIV